METPMELRHVRAQFFKAMSLLLGILERLFVMAMPNKTVPTIWIIGPPRSGTTLLYQLLIRRYKLAYISNFAAMFPKSPVLAQSAANLLFNPQNRITGFESDYGRTANRLGPHEAGPFWYRWFPKGDHVYVPPASVPEKCLRQFKKEIVGLSLTAKAPALFKNVYNTMRISPIVETFSNACFLVCHRDPIDVAQSILNGRVKLYDEKSKWMGVPPKEYHEIKDHPYWQQITEQVYYVYQQIESDKKCYGADRFFEVDYEQLCKRPIETLEQIAQFLSLHSIELQITGDVPERFPFSTGKKVDDKDYQHILRETARLWK
jgi:hypothetical protein